MTDVRHCPRCELRFGNRVELVDHLVVEHGFTAEALEPFRYRSSSSEVGQPHPGRRCLVVANQTIGGPELMAAIRDRIASGVTRFLVLVPATALADQWNAPVTGAAEDHLPGAPSRPAAGADDVAVALAEARLRSLIAAVAAEECEAQGHVGPADPELAVMTLLRAQRVDEILVATLPVGISRWLAVDLPSRLRRRCGLPVTTVQTATTRSADRSQRPTVPASGHEGPAARMAAGSSRRT